MLKTTFRIRGFFLNNFENNVYRNNQVKHNHNYFGKAAPTGQRKQ